MRPVLIALLSLLILVCAATARAQDLPMQDFAHIPVQHEGRLKPLDTFARVMLKNLNGKDHTDDMSATEWLAETMFDPLEASTRPVFLVRDSYVRHRLGLTERSEQRYSYAELTAGLGKTVPDIEAIEKKSRESVTPQDRALLKIHEQALLYTQIMRTLTLILPLSLEIPEPWAKEVERDPDGTVTYLGLRKYEQDIQKATKTIVAKKGPDPSAYSARERATATLSYQLSLLGEASSRNQLLRLIPVDWAEAGGEWQSPWAILQQGQGSPDTGKILKLWREMASAWQSGDRAAWLRTGAEAVAFPLTLTGTPGWKFGVEVAFNQAKPFSISAFLYALAFLLSLTFFIALNKWFRGGGLVLLSGGLLVHGAGIATRMLLLGRPPVSTLYESIIVVAFICAAIGLLLERRLKKGIGLLAGALSGLMLTVMGGTFDNEDDTLKLLSAVLDTNFWLATHVMCITIGYGWCVIVAVLAHLDLTARACGLATPKMTGPLVRITAHISVAALLFTAIGTILGGIWADQSWGRFWGWDPKENGALLIVLWLTWLLHGKLSGHLTPLRLLAGQAFLSVVVGAAWLGVNLLGVGLHSYGFADGLFWGLGLFALGETLFIGAMWRLALRREARLAS